MVRTNLQIHFIHHHVRDTVVITKEGNRPHRRCMDRDIFVPWAELNRRHLVMELCARGSERKRRRLEEEEAQVGEVMVFYVYYMPLETSSLFKCLGSLLKVTDYDWPDVITGIICLGSWGGRAWIIGRWGIFSSWLSRPSYCSGRICGCQPPTLSEFWGGSTIGWHVGSRGKSHGGRKRGWGSTLLWSMRCGCLVLRRLKHISPGGRKRWRST